MNTISLRWWPVIALAGLCWLLGAGGAAEKEEAANARPPRDEKDRRAWLENMVWHHRFSVEEIMAATGLGWADVDEALTKYRLGPDTRPAREKGDPLLVLPYPGGRHPRIGFLEGAIDPQRETKISVFAPWDQGYDYVVIDVPEAIRWQHGILYLAHTHVPTAWTEKGVELPALEWNRGEDGTFEIARKLPNGVKFGAKIVPRSDHVAMELWLENGSDEILSDMRVQNCAMLKGMPGFVQLTNENKVFEGSYAACRNAEGTRWVIMAWDPLFKGWGNAKVPCLHSDPKFPDCPPGERRELKGWFSFYEGKDVEAEFARIEARGWRE